MVSPHRLSEVSGIRMQGAIKYNCDAWMVGPAGNRFPHELIYMQFAGAGEAYIVGSRGGGSDGGV